MMTTTITNVIDAGKMKKINDDQGKVLVKVRGYIYIHIRESMEL